MLRKRKPFRSIDCYQDSARNDSLLSTQVLFSAIVFLPSEEFMRRAAVEPRVAEEGVAFVVEVGFGVHAFFISRNALAHLSRLKGGQLDSLETYRAFEDHIHSVARRHVVAGTVGSPIVLGAASFS
jgi:hypothetical protein